MNPIRFFFSLFIVMIVSFSSVNAQCCNFTYQQQVEPITSAATFGVALGDFDNDNDSDVVAVSAYYGVDVYFNNGSGTYTLNAQYATGTNPDFYGAHVGDVDGDGDRDIIVAPFYPSSELTVLKNNGSGIFTVTSFSSNIATHNFAMGDIDGDLDLDILLPNWQGGDGKVMKNNGSGGYSVFQSIPAAKGHDVAFGDIDGDGDLDAFVTENGFNVNSVFLNNGSGTFTQSGSNFGTAGGEVALGDFDGDLDLDAWVGTSGSTSELWINNGSGTFMAGPVITNGYYCKGLVLSDNDSDGDLDVFMSFYGGNPEVWTNNGNLSFSLCYRGAVGSSSHSLAVGDINGDGRKDMYTSYFSNDDGDYVFLQGNNNSSAISYTGSPFITSISTPQSVTQTGAAGGTYSASPSGLTINTTTGAITPSTSTPNVYVVSYNVSGCIATDTIEILAVGTPDCDSSGNVLVFANYDGGVLNINVDVNIPNLKIGVCTYEPVVINLAGTYASNVTKVIRAGFPNTTNNHCGGVTSTAINGPVPANYYIENIPPVTLNNSNGYNFGIICATSCDITSPTGGCNTIDQVVDYFVTQFGGSLYSLKAQYCCWQNSAAYNVSSLSNSCCVSSSPTATIAYTGSPYCQSISTPQTVLFTGSTSGTYSASPSGLSINSATGEIVPGLSSTGTYTVTYSIPGCPAAFTTTASLSIVADASATIAYAADEFCLNASIQSVTQTGTTGGIYSVSPIGLSLDTITGAFDPSMSVAGNYVVTYTLPSSGSCNAVTAKDTLEIAQPIATSFSAGICNGATYTFGSQTLDTAGTYLETFTSSNGCDSLVTLTLSKFVVSVPPLLVADTVLCSGDSSQICVPGGYSSYHWNTQEADSCIYAKNAGDYYVVVTDANNCSVQSARQGIDVLSPPSVSTNINGDTLKAFGAVAYQWFLNGNAIGGAQDSVFVALVSGSYQVEVTDVNGCKAISAPAQITVTGVIEHVTDDLKIYPNPIENDKLNFEIGIEWMGTELEIFNSTGQLVYESVISALRFGIDLKLEQGLYYLHLRSKHNTIVKKLIHL